MNGLTVIPALFALWLSLIAAGWWLSARRDRRERMARVDRLDRQRRTVTKLDA